MSFKKYYLLSLKILLFNLFFSGFLLANNKFYASNLNEELSVDYLRKTKEDEFYIIGPGDTLSLSVSEDTLEFDQIFSINGEGQTNLKRLKTIYIEGLTIDELTKLLNKEYSKYIKEPDVELNVIGYRPISVYIDGEVENTGVHLLPGASSSKLNIAPDNRAINFLMRTEVNNQNKLDNNNDNAINFNELSPLRDSETSIVSYFPTLVDALRRSGGLMMNANLTDIKITRKNPLSKGGGRITTSINLLDILDLKDVSQNIRLYDGDTISVERNEIPIISQISKALKSNINPKYINIFVSGRVNNPGAIKINKISTLNDAIALSGGAKVLRGPVRFLRYKNDGTTDKRKISLRANAKQGSYHNPFLKEGDLIYVGKSAFNVSSEVIKEVASPFEGLITTIGIYRFFND